MKHNTTWKVHESAILGASPLRSIPKLELEIGPNARLLANSIIYKGSTIGKNLIIGHNSIIREENIIGDNFKLWNNSNVDYGCSIGNNVKIHCNCYIAQFTVIEDDVFIAPAVTLTNDKYPGSKDSTQNLSGPIIRKGAQIGARVTILPGVEIGRAAVIGAGSLVTKNIPPNSLAYGSPAKVICKVSDLKVDGSEVY